LETLPVPVLVANDETLQALLQEPRVRQSLEYVKHCDIAYVGLGNIAADTTLVRIGLLKPADIRHLEEKGVVGEILMRYYDEQGRHISSPWESRIISLDWETIRRIPHVVVIAAGEHKIKAITAALRGGLCHTLVTDTDTARAVLEQLGKW
ncbi:MAG: hypothetical protein N2646_07620, partial [Bellilinea sp.]|nr:hypothetical protein [Bellilinea sp.]